MHNGTRVLPRDQRWCLAAGALAYLSKELDRRAYSTSPRRMPSGDRGGAAHTELLVQVLQVRLDRLAAQVQLAPDRRCGLAAGREAQDLELARAEQRALRDRLGDVDLQPLAAGGGGGIADRDCDGRAANGDAGYTPETSPS